MSEIDRLHVAELGERGSRVLFCHGLFGQGRNWTGIAKSLAGRHRVTLVDMPNHGRSAWTDELDLIADADAVAGLIDPADPVALIGHSMGGKTAMLVALRHPELVERLVVVDVAPADYASGSEFAGYIAAMRAMELGAIATRQDADAALLDAVPNRTVREFLLQNLRREGDSWRWQPNLALLGDQLDRITGWPDDRLSGVAPYEGPVLWIAGEWSDYVRDEHVPAMEALFPRVRRVTVKKAGHWVHSQQPEVFVEVVRRFLDAGATESRPRA
ncbi:alpha/beta fold hydrolase [Nocardioides daejeonensis]|uniref:alpha/beta fold hydrolase n=1 Tax=Nocardioides daejeonensis TaxID=1046556 RepID=UPI001EF3E729|nr:alpha/beta fold hydrolase [Nocardioides daejeonensis]